MSLRADSQTSTWGLSYSQMVPRRVGATGPAYVRGGIAQTPNFVQFAPLRERSTTPRHCTEAIGSKVDMEQFECRVIPTTAAGTRGAPGGATVKSLPPSSMPKPSALQFDPFGSAVKGYTAEAVQAYVVAAGHPCPPQRVAFLMAVHDTNRDGRLDETEMSGLREGLKGSTIIHEEVKAAWRYLEMQQLGQLASPTTQSTSAPTPSALAPRGAAVGSNVGACLDEQGDGSSSSLVSVLATREEHEEKALRVGMASNAAELGGTGYNQHVTYADRPSQSSPESHPQSHSQSQPQSHAQSHPQSQPQRCSPPMPRGHAQAAPAAPSASGDGDRLPMLVSGVSEPKLDSAAVGRRVPLVSVPPRRSLGRRNT